MRKTAFAFLAFVLLVSGLPAVEARKGKVRIAVDNLSGTAVLYRRGTDPGSRWEPLVFGGDSRTSPLWLSVDGRNVKLSESTEYRMSARAIPSGVEIRYSSPMTTVVQKILFAKFLDSPAENGFRIVYELRNDSLNDVRFSLRQILDTVQGEKSGIHFATDLEERIGTEREFDADSPEAFVISPGESASMAVLLKGRERPEIAVVANWKRLADADWEYDNFQQGFSHPPYSVNDSAIALYWNGVIVKAGERAMLACCLVAGGNGKDFTRELGEKL